MFPTVSPTLSQFTGLNRVPASSPIQARTNQPVPAFKPGRLRQDTVSFGASVQQDYAPGSHATGAGGDDPRRPWNFNPFDPPADAPIIPTESELGDEALKEQGRKAGQKARIDLLATNPNATQKELRRAYDKAYSRFNNKTASKKNSFKKYNKSDKGLERDRKHNKTPRKQDTQKRYRERDIKKAVELLEILDPNLIPPDTGSAQAAAATLQQRLQSIGAPPVGQLGLARAIEGHRRRQRSQASDSQSQTSASLSQPFSNLQINPFSHPPRSKKEAEYFMAWGRRAMAMANNWEEYQEDSGSITPRNDRSEVSYTFFQDGLPVADAVDYRYLDGTRVAFALPSLTQSLGESQRKPNKTHKNE